MQQTRDGGRVVKRIPTKDLYSDVYVVCLKCSLNEQVCGTRICILSSVDMAIYLHNYVVLILIYYSGIIYLIVWFISSQNVLK